jgi:hypothetical protein
MEQGFRNACRDAVMLLQGNDRGEQARPAPALIIAGPAKSVNNIDVDL